MSEIQTPELSRRIQRSLGIKEQRGYGLVEAIQPVIIVGDATGPGQRDQADVTWFSPSEFAGIAGFSLSSVLQNDARNDWCVIEQVELFNESASPRSVNIGVGYDRPALSFVGATCPELGATVAQNYNTVRVSSGFGSLATPTGTLFLDAILPNERRTYRDIPIPPQAYVQVFVGIGAGAGQFRINFVGRAPIQAS